jgi:prefoldin subunit 5
MLFFVFMVLGFLAAFALYKFSPEHKDLSRHNRVLTIVACSVLILSVFGLLAQLVWAPGATGVGRLLESLGGICAGFLFGHWQVLSDVVRVNVAEEKQEELVDDVEEDEADELQQEIDAFQEEIDDLQEEIDGLEEEKGEHQSAIEEHEQEIADARAEIEEIEVAIKERRDAIEERRRRIAELEQQEAQVGRGAPAQPEGGGTVQPADAAACPEATAPAADGQAQAPAEPQQPVPPTDVPKEIQEAAHEQAPSEPRTVERK